MRMIELAEVTLSSRSRLSHAVARLQELGWVERRSCDDDRRGQLAVLTDAGFGALRDAAPGHVGEVRRRLFDPLSPEQAAQLADACRAVLTSMGHDADAIAATTD